MIEAWNLPKHLDSCKATIQKMIINTIKLLIIQGRTVLNMVDNFHLNRGVAGRKFRSGGTLYRHEWRKRLFTKLQNTDFLPAAQKKDYKVSWYPLFEPADSESLLTSNFIIPYDEIAFRRKEGTGKWV